jgi:hypothetical protein
VATRAPSELIVDNQKLSLQIMDALIFDSPKTIRVLDGVVAVF